MKIKVSGFARISVICILVLSTITTLAMNPNASGGGIELPDDPVIPNPEDAGLQQGTGDGLGDIHIDVDLDAMMDLLCYDSDRDALCDNYELEAVYSAKFQSDQDSPVTYNDPDDPLYVSTYDETHRIPRDDINQAVDGASGTVDLYDIGFEENDFESGNTWFLTNGGSIIYAYVMSTTVMDAEKPMLYFRFLGHDKYVSITTNGKSDPNDPDTDNDGWWDGDEVRIRHTSPIDADTDNDWVRDPNDFDPIVDLRVTVEIKEILEQESPDGSDNFGDYYAKVFINNRMIKSTHSAAGNGHTFPNIRLGMDVPDDDHQVGIIIQIWDYDPKTEDEHMDVARHGRDVNVVYDLRTALWNGGDDSQTRFDKNAYGQTSGLEDGTMGSDECDIWFDIFQNDYDADWLTYHQEMNVLGTDPTLRNHDTDWDGMPDWWELRFGLDRRDGNDADVDDDRDHLTNVEEFDLGTDPGFFEPNLIVSMDWDADQDYIDDFVKGMRKASDFLWDATDGYMYFRHVVIFDNREHWGDADIRVMEGNADDPDNDPHWPHASVGGYLRSGAIVMPETFDGSGPTKSKYYKTIIHEWGHYGLRCWDEYIDAQEDRYPREGGVPQGPEGIMNYQYEYEELTTTESYDEWTPPDGFDTTRHFHITGVSCWEAFFNEYEDIIWFDLDGDGSRDDEYFDDYLAVSGPDMLVEGGYMIFEIHNT